MNSKLFKVEDPRPNACPTDVIQAGTSSGRASLASDNRGSPSIGSG